MRGFKNVDRGTAGRLYVTGGAYFRILDGTDPSNPILGRFRRTTNTDFGAPLGNVIERDGRMWIPTNVGPMVAPLVSNSSSPENCEFTQLMPAGGGALFNFTRCGPPPANEEWGVGITTYLTNSAGFAHAVSPSGLVWTAVKASGADLVVFRIGPTGAPASPYVAGPDGIELNDGDTANRTVGVAEHEGIVYIESCNGDFWSLDARTSTLVGGFTFDGPANDAADCVNHIRNPIVIPEQNLLIGPRWDRGVLMIDIADPDAPRLLNQLGGPFACGFHGRHVAALPGLIAINDGVSRIRLYDTTNPISVIPLGEVTLTTTALFRMQFSASGTHLYVSGRPTGLSDQRLLVLSVAQ